MIDQEPRTWIFYVDFVHIPPYRTVYAKRPEEPAFGRAILFGPIELSADEHRGYETRLSNLSYSLENMVALSKRHG